MASWINFKELRSSLNFEQVLRHYGVEVKRRGHQHQGFCPLPNHNGTRNTPSFSANLDRGIFQCFGCGAKGNILEFAGMMEKISLEDGTAFRAVAIALQRKFCPKVSDIPKGRTKPAGETLPKAEPKGGSLVVVNAPLDFELKGLDQTHPYLRRRGFTPETIKDSAWGFAREDISNTDWPFLSTPMGNWSAMQDEWLMILKSRGTILVTASRRSANVGDKSWNS